MKLLRFPAVFTAMADIFMGFLLTHEAWSPAIEFVLLVVASSCLYLSGMVLNDVFDRRKDAIDRPNRPLPSGSVDVSAAVGLGALLLLLGVVAAGFAGLASLMIAIGLAGLVLAYDGLLKNTPLGPVAMGGCRSLNVVLGASTYLESWSRPQWCFALALGIYIAGVTWFASREAKTGRRASLLGALCIVNLALLLLLAMFTGALNSVTGPGIGRTDGVAELLLLAVVAFAVDSRSIRAVWNPIPERVQLAVKSMLLAVIVLDATIVVHTTGNPSYGLVTACLMLPAIGLARWISVT